MKTSPTAVSASPTPVSAPPTLVSAPDRETYVLEANNNIILTSSTPFPPSDLKTLNSNQQALISILSKISLALTYYDAGVTDNIYKQLIDGEIYKAVSLTIDSNLLNTILLKNTKRAPKNVKALEILITNMYDEPEIVDKLIETYEKACDLLKEKLETYIKILTENSTILNTFNFNFTNVIVEYKKYINDVETKKGEFSKKILDEVNQLLTQELSSRRSSRHEGRPRSSTTDTSKEKDELTELDKELDDLVKEQSKLKAQQSEIQQQQLEATSGKKKTFLKKLLQPFKQAAKGVVKNLSDVSSSIQDALKKKSNIEIKLAAKTKIFGLETYRNIVRVLKDRTARVHPSGGKRKRNTKKHRNINKNKLTRKKNKRIKRKNTRKYIKRRNVRQTRNKN